MKQGAWEKVGKDLATFLFTEKLPSQEPRIYPPDHVQENY